MGVLCAAGPAAALAALAVAVLVPALATGYGCDFGNLAFHKVAKTNGRELRTDVDSHLVYDPADGLPVIVDIFAGKLQVTFCADPDCSQTLYTRNARKKNKGIRLEGPLMAAGFTAEEAPRLAVAARSVDPTVGGDTYHPRFIKCHSNDCWGNDGADLHKIGSVAEAEPRAMLIDARINGGFAVVPVHETTARRLVMYYCRDHACATSAGVTARAVDPAPDCDFTFAADSSGKCPPTLVSRTVRRIGAAPCAVGAVVPCCAVERARLLTMRGVWWRVYPCSCCIVWQATWPLHTRAEAVATSGWRRARWPTAPARWWWTLTPARGLLPPPCGARMASLLSATRS